MKEISRRFFLKFTSLCIFLLAFIIFFPKRLNSRTVNKFNKANTPSKSNKLNLGVDPDGFSRIYIAKNGTPEQNIKELIKMVGGIEGIVGKDDIVILKPNAMWSNFRITNTNAIKGLIELILDIPNFSGEIIIAENHHFSENNARGWTTTERNGDFNLNELIEYFNKKGCPNVTKYHWHDAGPNPWPRDGDAGYGRKVNEPKDGDGYVWRSDMVYISPGSRKCMMTYPIFTSAYSGITIDLKNGAWKNGKYLNTSVTFINFSAINHHTSYGGVTASIKNLMGVVDMTCGYQGSEPKGFYNMHWVGQESFLHLAGSRVRDFFNHRDFRGIGSFINRTIVSNSNYKFEYAGGALGYWMKNIRFPALNIIAAEWVGYGSKNDIKKSGYSRTILASKDPVALDYYAAKSVLLPLTKSSEGGEQYIKLHDPDNKKGPFRKFLEECHKQGIGNLEENKLIINSYDLKAA